MSQLSQSLEKRIQELTASIEAQRAELAAYQHVLHMEMKGASVSLPIAPMGVEESPVTAQDPAQPDGAPFSGTKTDLVLKIITGFGAQGATPKDIDAGFQSRRVGKSKNFIYNTLGYFVNQKKVERRDGRYFVPANSTVSHRVPAKKKAKRKISPDGLRRIREALKKRWAAQKAAAKTATKKRAVKKAAKKKST